jgi:hypothetical protein
VTQASRTPDNRVINRHPGTVHFNVKGVLEALIEQGYDPTVEVVKILKGRPDPDNAEQRVYDITPALRLQFSAELMKFVHPTKKAVDVNQRLQLSDGELNNKLGTLLGKYAELMGGSLPAEVIDAAAETQRLLAHTGEEPADDQDYEGAAAAFDPRDLI